MSPQFSFVDLRPLGALAESNFVGIAIWYLYYFGVFIIAVGIVQTLVRRGHYPDGEAND